MAMGEGRPGVAVKGGGENRAVHAHIERARGRVRAGPAAAPREAGPGRRLLT